MIFDRIRIATLAALALFSAPLLTSCGASSSAVAADVPTQQGAQVERGPDASRKWSTDALLFAGDGTWSPEVAALESLLQAKGAKYQKVSSAELESMSVDAMAQHGIMIFPGGKGGTQAKSLSAEAHARIREAVQQRGVSYIGFCAGAFISQAPAPAPGKDVSYGLGVVDGPELEYYYLENEGTEVAMTMHTFADGSKADILWYGGPKTPAIPGGVVAKYPNGDPAITQTWSGNGFVMIVGGHPVASESMTSSLGLKSSDGSHEELTWKLIESTMRQTALPAFAS